jgi:glycosyltransferase involved in cell wall biosynthesis
MEFRRSYQRFVGKLKLSRDEVSSSANTMSALKTAYSSAGVKDYPNGSRRRSSVTAMRVLHIYTGNLYGGIETLLSTLARCRNRCPIMEPHFALCFQGRLSEELNGEGADLYDLGHVRARNLLSIGRARRRLAVILRTQKIEVVICHAVWSQVMFGPVARRAGVRLVFWQHDAVTGKGWLEGFARRVRPEMVLTNSLYSQSTLNHLYPRIRSNVVLYPVEAVDRQAFAAKRDEIRQQMSTPSTSSVIVQLSRMERWKGHEFHLRALARLKHLSHWECWIVGGPQRAHEAVYFEQLKQLARSLDIQDRIRFVGQRKDPLQILAAADIHCQPNIGPEPFGLTFIEALAMGLPVVTTRLGAAQEIVNETCGLLVMPGDSSQLADALERLVSDSVERKRLGDGGPRRAAILCDAGRQLNQLANILRSPADVQ